MKHRVLALAAVTLLASCGEAPTQPRMAPTPPEAAVAPTRVVQALAAQPWTAAGPGTVTLLNDGSTANPSMSYALSGGSVFSTQTWSFSSTAAVTGAITENYDYSGFHAHFQVRVFIKPFIIHNAVKSYLPGAAYGPANCCSAPSSGFHYTSSTTFNVVAGDTYGFEFGGSNYDSDSRLLGTFTIVWPERTPTTTTVSFGSGPFVYTGSAFTATAAVDPSGTASIVYSGDCINAGSSCTAKAMYAGDETHFGSQASASITIARAPTTTTVSFSAASYVYTGSAITATASAGATIAYTGNCTNVGTCTATATTAEDANHFGSSEVATAAITPAPTTTTVSFGAGPFVFTGSAFTATAAVSPSGAASIAYSGDCVNAGSTCTATASYAGDPNHTGSSDFASIAITYVFGGFLQPIPLPVSTFKGGSTIPVKFRVLSAGGASVAHLVNTVSVNGGPSLGTAKYDADGEQYHFNLSTKGLPLGALTIKVSLGDGTSRSVVVTLK